MTQRRRRTLAALLASLLLGTAFAATLAEPVGADPEADLAGVVQLTAGEKHTCARVTGGQVRCFGQDLYGQLGDGTAGGPSTITTVLATTGAGPLTGVTSIAAGTETTCALLNTHQVRCWGRNFNGSLGNASNTAQSARPVVVRAVSGAGALTHVTQIAGGYRHFCARLDTGQVVCWGDNEYRQLGDATTTNRSRPVRVKAPLGSSQRYLTGVTQVVTGGIHTCFRLSNGQARCVGNNSAGNLGDGTTTERDLPVAVRKPTGPGNLTGVTSLAAGQAHTCARLSTNQVRCWGANFTGQVGDNTNTQRPRPVTVKGIGGTGALADVTQLVAGTNRTCARRSDGTAVCWGQNASGQGGDTTTTNPRLAPVAVAATGITQITAGPDHGCARLSTGGAVCYGNNDFGQLGTGSGFGNHPTPAAVQA
jgi:alpha-tubulin suppressor-like RCC1 family protein